MNTDLGFDLYFPREYLRAVLIVSLLSVWVLVGLFFYLNRYTKRHYFTVWAVAWLFYAVWLTLNISVPTSTAPPYWAMLKQWCVGISGVFLLWGSSEFLKQGASQRMLGLFMLFLFVWSWIGAYHVDNLLAAYLPTFALLGLASELAAWGYFKFRRQRRYIGAGLLSWGFAIWGVYLLIYPFFLMSDSMVSSGFFISAVLHLFIAVSMIILVLEEARTRYNRAMDEVIAKKTETQFLKVKVSSTEERYRSLFDQASEGIVITTAENLEILELNQTAKRLLGVNGRNGKPLVLSAFLKVAEVDPLPVTGSEWFDVLQRQHQLSVVRRDGGTTPAEVDGAPIHFDGRNAYQFFFRELTERTRLEQQLRQAEKLSALGQMISGIAHELNNPLAVVKGYLDLVLSRHELAPQTRADLERVATESNRAAKLVSNFLAFAREQPAHRERLDLNQLIKRVVELREFEVRGAGAALTLDLAPDLPAATVDSDQVQQILINLVNNALHALAEKAPPRRLAIRSRQCANQIQVTVEDNGPGVPEALVTRIFEPFFTTKEVGTGTGLGLSIAHSIMADHQGSLSYQSTPGGGASFVLEFPLADSAGAMPSASDMPTQSPVDTTSPPPSASPARILIVDDETSIAELLGEMLGMLGYQPTLCHAAPQALEIIARNEFDVVLSDFRMPVMDGQEFYRLAVEKKPSLARRFIFLSGDVVNEDTQNFLGSIGTPHLAKPFQLTTVEEAVIKVLREHAQGSSPDSSPTK